MLPRSGGYAQKTTLVGIRASDDEEGFCVWAQVKLYMG